MSTASSIRSSTSVARPTTSRSEIGVTLGRSVASRSSRVGLGGLGQVDRRHEGVRSAGEGMRVDDEQEVEAAGAPVDLAPDAGDARFQIAAEHVEGERVAQPDAVASRDLLVDRDQRRPGIVGWPPLAAEDLGALGDTFGIGQAAVAAHRPGDIVRDLDLGDGAAGDAYHPRPQARQELLQLRARHRAEVGAQRLLLLRLDVDQIERRRLDRQAQGDLVVQVARDHRHRREQCHARTQGDDHPGRGRARPMEVRDREAECEPAAMPQTARPRASGEA